MTDYYSHLGLDKAATQKEIKKAYKRLVLSCHPDKVPGKEEDFNRLREAYETLSDPEKKTIYDNKPIGNHAYMAHYKKEGLNFVIAKNVHQCNYYQYINGVLKLSNKEKLKSGQDILNQDFLWEKLEYVAYRIGERKRYLRQHYPKPQGDIKRELDSLCANSRKNAATQSVLLSCRKRKFLYDLTLNIPHSEEMQELAEQIGGRENLIDYINKDPFIYAAYGIFALKEAHCLTPANFLQLINFNRAANACHMSAILCDLLENQLLTQANFDLAMQYKLYPAEISTGLSRLSHVGIFTQSNFEVVVRSGKNARSVGSDIEGLYKAGILNEKNIRIITQKAPGKRIWRQLLAMRQEGLISRAQTEVLHWRGPDELEDLNQNINNMFTYGLFLLTEDVEKGRAALLLALELKQDLKQFFEKDPEMQAIESEVFRASFIEKLHSKDEVMSGHRKYWKVIVTNIAIAFTGLGLFALAVNYIVKGQGFFAQTKRERLIEEIQATNWLAPVSG